MNRSDITSPGEGNTMDPPPKKARGWMITSYDLWLRPDKIDGIQYTCWQKEECPTTKRHHLQIFTYFKSAKTFGQIKKLIGNGHIEPARRIDDCIDYCQKDETRVEGPWEHGDIPEQGKRTDIENLKTAIMEGASMETIAKNFSMQYVRYNKGIALLRSMLSGVRTWPTEVHIIWGPPNTNKTRRVWDESKNVYVKANNKWWDNYDLQETVLIDDFDNTWQHSISRTDWLTLTDRYPHHIEIKGGTVKFLAKKIYITSNYDPKYWYMYDEAFQRRVTTVTYTG